MHFHPKLELVPHKLEMFKKLFSKIKQLACMLSLSTCWDPMDYSLSDSTVHEIFQARILEGIAISSSRGSSLSGIKPASPALAGMFLITEPPGKLQFSSVVQLCPSLCDPMNCSMPGLPSHHQLPEFTQTHVHRVGDAVQSSHPLSSPSPPAPNPSQHQSLFQ